MSFGAGQARQTGGAFYRGNQTGRVFSTVDTPDGRATALVDGGVVGSMGEDRIAQSTTLRSQARERVFNGAPKFWRVTNRAKLGNVKVWMGAFDGEVFPEGATDDKTTWLQPGESMIVPMDAGLHFVGNVFDPRVPEAREVIERCGGFELETETATTAKNAPVRIIGGPIGLPDFIVEPMDGRGRLVGDPVAVYEIYDKATRKLWVNRRGKDPDVIAAEKELLADRIREYTLADAPLYGAHGEIVSTVESRADAATDDLPDMTQVDADGTLDETADPTLTPRRPRTRT